MKRILVLVSVVFSVSVLECQISMQTNLPKVVPVNTDITFEVKIDKGASTNFAKYQMEVPRGATIKEVDSKSGSFTFEDNQVKIIWVMVPHEPEITISMKLNTGVIAGKKIFGQKYFYVENDDKKEVEMEPYIIHIRDTVVPGEFAAASEFMPVAAKTQPSLLTTTINAAEISTKNPELLKQQVMQLKKDSRDAYEVGEREKRKAQINLDEANKAIAAADAIADENEKKAALDKANTAKTKAENDLEVASRVLVLAKSLSDNADEIENINRSVNPTSYSGMPVASTPHTHVNAAGNTIETTAPASQPETITVPETETPAGATAPESGLVYKIQLGAFSKEPAKSDFRALGKVKISQENGMYKVLYGSYASKDEAFRQREQIIKKGFDGFVVSYQDGVRVK